MCVDVAVDVAADVHVCICPPLSLYVYINKYVCVLYIYIYIICIYRHTHTHIHVVHWSSVVVKGCFCWRLPLPVPECSELWLYDIRRDRKDPESVQESCS